MVESRSLIKMQVFLKAVNSKGKNAVHVFQDITGRIDSYNGNLTLCKRVFLNSEMPDSNSVSKRGACAKLKQEER